MYTLRLISNNGLETNYFLGDSYSIFRRSSIDSNEFSNLLDEHYFEISDQEDKIKATLHFVDSALLENKIPIIDTDKAYIMHANGQTLQKL
jgi:hypothetical protein